MIPHPRSLPRTEYIHVEMANPVLYLVELKNKHEEFKDKVAEGKRDGRYNEMNPIEKAYIASIDEYMRKCVYEYELSLTAMCN